MMDWLGHDASRGSTLKPGECAVSAETAGRRARCGGLRGDNLPCRAESLVFAADLDRSGLNAYISTSLADQTHWSAVFI